MSADQELEKAIEAIGRDRVFARARALGWTEGSPPKWVWWGVVAELRQEDQLNAETAVIASVPSSDRAGSQRR